MGSLSSLLVALLGLGLAYNSILSAEARPLYAGSPREGVVGMLIIPYYWKPPSPSPPPPATPSGPSPLLKGTPGGSFSAPRINQSQSNWTSLLNSYLQLQRSPAPPPPPPKVAPPSHPVKEDSLNTGHREDFHDMMGRQSGSHQPPPRPLKAPTLFGSGSPDCERPSTSPPPPPRVSPPSRPITRLDRRSPPTTAATFYVASH